MRHDFYTDAFNLQFGSYLLRRKFQGLAGANDDHFRIEFTDCLAMFGRQFIDMRRFPELNDVRCDDDAAIQNFFIDRDLSIAVGADTIGGK